MCQRVIDAGGEGKTLAEMANDLDIARDTLNEWRKAYPEVSAAVKRGLEKSQAWWEGKGRSATFGKVDGFNATSYIFQMKNRFREEWNDTVKQEHAGAIEHKHGGSAKLLDYLDAVSSRAAGDAAD